jgi:Flp pilus assembly protein TadB
VDGRSGSDAARDTRQAGRASPAAGWWVLAAVSATAAFFLAVVHVPLEVIGAMTVVAAAAVIGAALATRAGRTRR